MGAGLVNPFLTVELTSGTATAVSPTSVQWDAAGGSPQGLVSKGSATEPGGNCKTEIWGVVPTATGTKQVKVNFAASVEITGGSASYQFVNQTTPYNAASPQSATFGGGTTLSLTVTSAAHEMVITCVVENGGSALTVPAGQNVIHNDNIGASQHAGASADAAGASTVTCAYGGVTLSNTRAIVGVSLQFDGGSSASSYLPRDLSHRPYWQSLIAQ